MLTILDTGAGPNLIRKDELDGDLTDLVKKKSTPELYDAKKNPLEVTGTIDLTVQLGTRTLVTPFLVVPKLAVPALLGADFCDEHVEAIRPRRRIVELDDGTTIPIVRRRFNNSLRDESSTYAKVPEIRPTGVEISKTSYVPQPMCGFHQIPNEGSKLRPLATA